jgi:ABC-type glycerol-3-phosphate transport system substrate-binding protein
MKSFCLSEETIIEVNKAGHWQTPCYLPAQENPFYQQPSEFFGGQKIRDIVFEAQEKTNAFYLTTDYVEASSYIANELMKAIEGQKDIDQAIKDAAITIREKIVKSF